jgi:nicotinamide-nucleotide amidase
MWSGGSQAAGVLDALARRGETLATAESLTGGLLAARLTDVPGASRSFVALLDVPEEVVERHGVVSQECASAMAQGVRTRLGATWGLATTGVAGPDEQEGHPVGTVWVAVADPSGVASRLLTLSGDRLAIRQATCDAVLSDLAARLGDVEVFAREEGALG